LVTSSRKRKAVPPLRREEENEYSSSQGEARHRGSYKLLNGEANIIPPLSSKAISKIWGLDYRQILGA
jgi:hypothetical protein